MTVAATSRSLVVSVLGIGIVVGGGLTYLALRLPPTATAPAATTATAPESRLKPSDASVTLTTEAVARANITLTPAESAKLGGVITIPGIIEPNAYKETVVTALVAGRVTRVLAELGQRVRRGQTLAELHSPELAEAQREFISASAELGAHEQQLARTERLVAIGSASRQELEMAHAEHTALTTRVEGARSRLRLLGFNADQIGSLASASQITATTEVRAPLDGVVTIRQANVGLNVEGTMPLFTVVDLSTVWVVGDLYEPDFPRVRVGSPVTIVVASYPDLALRGTISYIDPQLSRETRTAKVRAEVQNGQGQLRLGMYAQMRIDSEGGGRVLPVIPKTAIQIIGDHAVVYVADPQTPGRFTETAIRTGSELGDRIAVESGITVGESVVISGSFFLRAERERLGLSDSGASTSR
jgi:cobalt-zinc-cadmium efflux system membrane fusion protein